MAVDDQRRHAQPLQPRAEPDAALAAAHDQHEGLARSAELGCIGLAAVGPGRAVTNGAVLDAEIARGAALLLEALELHQRGEQGERLAVLQPQMATSATDRGLEGEPALAALELEGARRHLAQPGVEHGGDRRPALERRDVPGEGHQVAPVTLLGEQRCCRGAVAAFDCTAEAGQPVLHVDVCHSLPLPRSRRARNDPVI